MIACRHNGASLQEASSWLGSTRAPVYNDGDVATVTGIPRDQGTGNTSLRHDLRAASFLSTCMTVVTHSIYTGVNYTQASIIHAQASIIHAQASIQAAHEQSVHHLIASVSMNVVFNA